ncbi:MAG: FAD-binding oxidoreductase [Candidatus Omnitrophica bacterium]|nr:FAD-binding oxidoreductase [Candidatus Omnitrophota bacterium]
MKNYLIIGQGIAGSSLAYHLLKAGARVVIVDHHHHESSSVVSTGILNPLSGKRFALTPGYDQYFAAATEFYADAAKLFSETFFEPMPVVRLLRSKSEGDKLQRKIETGEISDYIFKQYSPGHFQSLLCDDQGAVEIRHGGVCHTSRLMEVLKQYFIRKGCLVNERFYYDEIGFSADGAIYQGEEFDKVIFCEGYKAQFNPWFQHLNFKSIKGEVLRVRMGRRDISRRVLLRGTWLAPSTGDLWAAGGSAATDELDGLPTAAGHDTIMDGLKNIIHTDAEVLHHQAAVRPFLNHQNPIVELHPRFPQMAIFNGLGSKGFLVAPWLAKHFAANLTGEQQPAADRQYV